jgi:hypothetical protein
MDWKIKTGLTATAVVVIGSLAFIIKTQYDANKHLQDVEKSVVESRDLGNGLVRAQSSYITKDDLEKLIKEHDLNLSAIKSDMSKLGADVKALSTITFTTPGGTFTNLPSSGSVARTDESTQVCVNGKYKDQYGYLTATQQLALNEPISDNSTVPFGTVGFSSWDKNPWSLQIEKRTYSANTVLGMDETGKHYAYSKFSIAVNGKEYDIPIHASLKEEVPSAKFRFDPHLFLSFDGGVIVSTPLSAEFIPNLGVSFFSYGKTKDYPTWTFAQLAFGYEVQKGNIGFLLAPVSYNIAEHLPLVKNLYFGPSISVDASRNTGILMGIRVGL